MRARTIARLAAAAWPLAGCGSDRANAPIAAPVIVSNVVAANSHNVLSAAMLVKARGADSVAVRYHLASEIDAQDSVTASVPISGDSALVPVLGLIAERTYVVRAMLYGERGTAFGDWLELTTAALPADLPHYAATGDAPSQGFVVFAADKYGLAIDNTGRVVWYHKFTNGPWLNFEAQPTLGGRYVARLVTPDPTDVESWIEIDPLGNTTRTFGCKYNLQPRFHDLIAEADGGYWILCDETRAMDLAAYGGVDGA